MSRSIQTRSAYQTASLQAHLPRRVHPTMGENRNNKRPFIYDFVLNDDS